MAPPTPSPFRTLTAKGAIEWRRSCCKSKVKIRDFRQLNFRFSLTFGTKRRWILNVLLFSEQLRKEFFFKLVISYHIKRTLLESKALMKSLLIFCKIYSQMFYLIWFYVRIFLKIATLIKYWSKNSILFFFCTTHKQNYYIKICLMELSITIIGNKTV